MKINVLYFANLRECTHTKQEIVEVDDDVTVKGALDLLCEAHPGLAARRRVIRTAVNEDMASASQPLASGDTLALMTPFAGGAEPYCRLTDQPLDMADIYQAVTGPRQGGIVTFVGLVRDHNNGKAVNRLEYEAYPPMVLSSLTEIVVRCEALSPGVRVAVAHRYGVLEIGDIAVVVAAAAPHRAEAFDAARECIELIKKDVPIWKKEFFPDGEEWIGVGA